MSLRKGLPYLADKVARLFRAQSALGIWREKSWAIGACGILCARARGRLDMTSARVFTIELVVENVLIRNGLLIFNFFRE